MVGGLLEPHQPEGLAASGGLVTAAHSASLPAPSAPRTIWELPLLDEPVWLLVLLVGFFLLLAWRRRRKDDDEEQELAGNR